MHRSRGSIPLALVALTAAAAAIRFSTLDLQSYWYNEAATVALAKADFGHMLKLIRDQEGNPPLYYLLAWVWTRGFGDGEIGLRSLSALAGTAMVPAAWWAIRRDAGQLAGLFFAGLVAFAPLLVWYSQEARPYILVALFLTVSSGFFLRAWDDPDDGRLLLGWALLSGVAAVTHYFAYFVIAPQGFLLLYRRLDRTRVVVAGAALVAVLAALAPLIDQQRVAAKTSASGSLATRVEQVPKQLVIAFDAPLENLLAALAIALALAATALALTRAEPGPRRAALLLGGTGAAAIVLALALAVLGQDYINTRNLIVALPLLLVPVAVGLAVPAYSAARVALAAGLTAIMCAAWLSVDVTTKFQRDDWRAAAESVGPQNVRRAIVVTPGQGFLPFRYYLPAARAISPEAQDRVSEIVVVGGARRHRAGGDLEAPRPTGVNPYPAFQLVQQSRHTMYTTLRFRASSPQPVRASDLATMQVGDGGTIVYVEPAR
jgi:mannosyltransferase